MGLPHYVVLTIEDTTTAAFADLGRPHEVSRLLAGAAARVRACATSEEFDLTDTNGNVVGSLRYFDDLFWEADVYSADASGRVRFQVDLSDMAFEQNGSELLATMLSSVSELVANSDGQMSIALLTPDKVKVGAFSMNELPVGALDAEKLLRDSGLSIIGVAEMAKWHAGKITSGAFAPSPGLHGWVSTDGWLTKEFYVRDLDENGFGEYRKAWYGRYDGDSGRPELFVTDHDHNEIELTRNSSLESEAPSHD